MIDDAKIKATAHPVHIHFEIEASIIGYHHYHRNAINAYTFENDAQSSEW
jgi:hypothetical protein